MLLISKAFRLDNILAKDRSSFAKTLHATLKGFLATWRKLFALDYRPIRQSAEDARRERGPDKGCALVVIDSGRTGSL
jgi:hypothetical protein